MVIVALVASAATGCGGSSGDDASTDTTSTDAGDVPTLADVADVELEDQRADLLAVLGQPDAFRVTFVTVDGVAIRHDTWDYLALETRIDLVDGQVVLTSALDPVADGTWLPAHVDPGDFEAGMTPDDVRARLDGVELRDVDLSELTGNGGTALVGGQLLVTFADDAIVSVETFPLEPDPDGLQADVIEAVTP